MNPIDLTQMPAVIALILVGLFILERVVNLAIPLIKDKKNGNGRVDLAKVARQVEDMHGWLGTRSPTGAFPWAVGPELAEALKKISEILDRQDRRTSDIERVVCDIHDELREMRRDQRG
jgi:hypothetical protein